MGNSLSPCRSSESKGGAVKLVFWGGATSLLSRSQLARELILSHPDHAICHADSFYIGRPVPALSAADKLIVGRSYLVIPVDRLPRHALTVASLKALWIAPSGPLIGLESSPLQYTKSAEGRPVIKVSPEFMARIISGGGGSSDGDKSGEKSGGGSLCSTPELQKHYSQLVGSRTQQWSPKLKTISETKWRFSGCDRR
ncbi:unnamed protein product [Spirodela intermedia]|uniref:Uncharacterized protein n=1 Tax=Spirodela intermedia TaxID=51605 RepID=A0A7I8JXH6_SPIIN|nr:unnamed protein product [Spirodela intermedia]